MRLFGLVGFPLSHSFSAAYFTEKFAKEQIHDASFRLFPIQNISEIIPLIINNADLLGFSVTIPYKISILPFLDSLEPEAKDIGAVNCVKIARNFSKIELTGYNTDIYGFKESLIPLLKPYHGKALILGTGGAAKAVGYVLQRLGIYFSLVSRNPKKDTALNYSELNEEIINDNLLIINTTPLGMYPETNRCPEIPYRFLNDKHLLFDLTYNPSETLFLKKGRKAGATTINGLKMLELQAEKSWEIWNCQK